MIPPLRERKEDVAPLAASFVDSFNREFRKNVKGIRRDALDILEAYPWPGNVRELRNVVERAMLLNELDELVPEDLPVELRDYPALGKPAPASPAAAAGPPRELDGIFDGGRVTLPAKGIVFEDVEKELVRQALARANGNQTRAASLLGLNRDQIRYRVEKFGLKE